jgi:hypothetical protein
MACLECGLEQAVAGAGTCARCGAPLPGAGHPSGTFTCPGGAKLRVDSSGITVVGKRNALARPLSGEKIAWFLSWDEIGWFRDGWHKTQQEKPGWTLHIVLAGGRGKQVTETWAAGRTEAPPELLALIRDAAAAHSIPAVLTGGEVCDGLPGKDAGLYYDPAGKQGLREWTGTEWSPFLQVDPGARGHPGQETGLARIWSPLSPAELYRQSRAVRRESRLTVAMVAVVLVAPILILMVIAAMMVPAHLDGSASPAMAAFIGALCVLFLAFTWAGPVRDARTGKRIAQALSAAATRALAQDDPPAHSTELPDLRTN